VTFDEFVAFFTKSYVPVIELLSILLKFHISDDFNFAQQAFSVEYFLAIATIVARFASLGKLEGKDVTVLDEYLQQCRILRVKYDRAMKRVKKNHLLEAFDNAEAVVGYFGASNLSRDVDQIQHLLREEMGFSVEDFTWEKIDSIVEKLRDYEPLEEDSAVGLKELKLLQEAVDYISSFREFYFEKFEKQEQVAEEEREVFEEQVHSLTYATLEFLGAVWSHFYTDGKKANRKVDYTFTARAYHVMAVIFHLWGIEGDDPKQIDLAYRYKAFVSWNGFCCACEKLAASKCARSSILLLSLLSSSHCCVLLRCGVMRYCSSLCQRNDWPLHKALCGKHFERDLQADLLANPPWLQALQLSPSTDTETK